MIQEKDVLAAFSVCVDPELQVDIWTLGLIYKYELRTSGEIFVLLTFTSPLCPYGPQMVEDLERLLKENGAKKVIIEVTFDPPWQPSEELREMLGV